MLHFAREQVQGSAITREMGLSWHAPISPISPEP